MSEETTTNNDKNVTITTTLPPLTLLPAKRVTGQVILPHSVHHPRLVSSVPQTPTLTRQASMKGNILEFHENIHYFLQRKLRNTSFGSVRVGFGLQPDGDDSEEEEGKATQQMYKVKLSIPYNPLCPYPLDMVAIKLFDRERMEAEEGIATNNIYNGPNARIEIEALSRIAKFYNEKKENDEDSPQEPRFVESSNTTGQDKFTYYAVVPFYGEGTLFQYVVECGTLPEPIARHYFQQILKGLQTLRDVGICHRNINLTTIQLHGDHCAITELSSCLLLEKSKKESSLPPQWAQGGNPRYIPPEVVRMEDFDGYAADLWAAGVCLWQMVGGIESPFVWASMEDARYRHLQEMDSSTSEGGIWNLLRGMLQANPSDRWTSLEQIWQQDWVQINDTRAPSFLLGDSTTRTTKKSTVEK